MDINRVTLQHDREFMMFRFIYFPLFMVLLCVITGGILSIPVCDVYVRLKTSGAAIEIARVLTVNKINIKL